MTLALLWAIFLVLSLTCLPLAARESGQEYPQAQMNPDTGLDPTVQTSKRSLPSASWPTPRCWTCGSGPATPI